MCTTAGEQSHVGLGFERREHITFCQPLAVFADPNGNDIIAGWIKPSEDGAG
jgi:hypothetical protein